MKVEFAPSNWISNHDLLACNIKFLNYWCSIMCIYQGIHFYIVWILIDPWWTDKFCICPFLKKYNHFTLMCKLILIYLSRGLPATDSIAQCSEIARKCPRLHTIFPLNVYAKIWKHKSPLVSVPKKWNVRRKVNFVG